MAPTLLLSADDIRRTARSLGVDRLMDRVIAALGEACARADDGGCSTPARAGFSYESPVRGLLEWMPALDDTGRASVKVVGYHPDNPRTHQLPTILSVVSLCDTRTGHLDAFLDATFLTAVRTGAASAVASRALAREDSRVLGLIGCGAQAVTQVHALSRTFPIERVLCWDCDETAVSSLARRLTPLGLTDLSLEPTPVDALVTASDILCTATSVAPGAGPVFSTTDVQPWLHINAVGSDFPGKTEVPATLVERAVVCADFLEQCLVEGECQQISADRVDTTLGSLVSGGDHAALRDRLTLFDSTGWALEDHVAAGILVEEARRLGVGTAVEIEVSEDRDPQSPYAFLGGEPRATGVPTAAVGAVTAARRP